MELHKIVKIKRKELNLGQDWFVVRLNVQQTHISRAENGLNNKLASQMAGLMLKEFPTKVKFTDFYPDDYQKRMLFIEERMGKMEDAQRDLISKLEEILKQFPDKE